MDRYCCQGMRAHSCSWCDELFQPPDTVIRLYDSHVDDFCFRRDGTLRTQRPYLAYVTALHQRVKLDHADSSTTLSEKPNETCLLSRSHAVLRASPLYHSKQHRSAPISVADTRHVCQPSAASTGISAEAASLATPVTNINAVTHILSIVCIGPVTARRPAPSQWRPSRHRCPSLRAYAATRFFRPHPGWL